ncbi:hypothetical protein ABZW47_29240 [Streptomyces sp. NPDC004549]
MGTFEFGRAARPTARAYEPLDTYYEVGGRLTDTALADGPNVSGWFRRP